MGKRIKEVEERLKDKEKNIERAEGGKTEGVVIRRGEDSSFKTGKDRTEKKDYKENKEDRRRNIVIKGIKPEGNLKRWVQEFLKDSIRVECGIEDCWMSGEVVIVKVEKDEDKREVMRWKKKLAEGRVYRKVFIENDLTWEDRKVQGRMNVWENIYRAKGKEIKVGFGRVRVDGEWKDWREVEGEGVSKEISERI